MSEKNDNYSYMFSYCVVYPKELYSEPDEKALNLSHEIGSYDADHHIIGISLNDITITDSMILAYDVICDKYLLFKTFDDFQKAEKDLCDLTYWGDQYLWDTYKRVQNLYFMIVNSSIDLPNGQNKNEFADKLYNLLLDIRLKRAESYMEELIRPHNVQLEQEVNNKQYVDEDGVLHMDDMFDFS